MVRYALAEVLHKSVVEILELSVAEVDGWIAYFEIKKQRDG
jgi:hypothetical protein